MLIEQNPLVSPTPFSPQMLLPFFSFYMPVMLADEEQFGTPQKAGLSNSQNVLAIE